jgi:hypothetical protein
VGLMVDGGCRPQLLPQVCVHAALVPMGVPLGFPFDLLECSSFEFTFRSPVSCGVLPLAVCPPWSLPARFRLNLFAQTLETAIDHRARQASHALSTADDLPNNEKKFAHQVS